MSTSNTTSTLVGTALLTIAGLCDGARRLDGTGFSRNDADFGRSLAQTVKTKGFSTEKQFAAAKKLALRYRRQLVEAGMDIDAIAAEAFDQDAAAANRTANEAARVEAQVARNAPVTRSVIITGESDKAYKVIVGGSTTWLPKSLTTFGRTVSFRVRRPNGATGITFHTIANVTVPAWMAAEKNMVVPAIPDDAFDDAEASLSEIANLIHCGVAYRALEAA